MKGLSRKKFFQVGRRLSDLVLCSRPLKLTECSTYPSARSVESINKPELHSTLITWQPIQSTLPKLLNCDFHSPC
jgi:hypothetical protein